MKTEDRGRKTAFAAAAASPVPRRPRRPLRTRTETDSFGAIEVPADRYWGAQTERSIHNFPIGEQRMPRQLIAALALVKRAAAETNRALGGLDARYAKAIVEATQDIAVGKLDDQFPLPVYQSGSGTQTNMNVNEAIDAETGAHGETAKTPESASEKSPAPRQSRQAGKPDAVPPPNAGDPPKPPTGTDGGAEVVRFDRFRKK